MVGKSFLCSISSSRIGQQSAEVIESPSPDPLCPRPSTNALPYRARVAPVSNLVALGLSRLSEPRRLFSLRPDDYFLHVQVTISRRLQMALRRMLSSVTVR